MDYSDVQASWKSRHWDMAIRVYMTSFSFLSLSGLLATVKEETSTTIIVNFHDSLPNLNQSNRGS